MVEPLRHAVTAVSASELVELARRRVGHYVGPAPMPFRAQPPSVVGASLVAARLRETDATFASAQAPRDAPLDLDLDLPNGRAFALLLAVEPAPAAQDWTFVVRLWRALHEFLHAIRSGVLGFTETIELAPYSVSVSCAFSGATRVSVTASDGSRDSACAAAAGAVARWRAQRLERHVLAIEVLATVARVIVAVFVTAANPIEAVRLLWASLVELYARVRRWLDDRAPASTSAPR
jgi:hypothetical protein